MALQRLLRASRRMCEVTHASTTVNVVGTTEGLAVGDRVKGQGIPAGATIATLAAASFTLSAAASFPSPPYPANYATQTELNFEGNGLANPGSSALGAYASVRVPEKAKALSLELELTFGTVFTYKYQGSLDGPDVLDASSDWFDLTVYPVGSDTPTAAPTAGATGIFESTVDLQKRPVSKVRLNVLSNTGSTWEGDVAAVVQD